LAKAFEHDGPSEINFIFFSRNRSGPEHPFHVEQPTSDEENAGALYTSTSLGRPSRTPSDSHRRPSLAKHRTVSEPEGPTESNFMLIDQT
jgi:hypothetical protein